MNKDYLGDGVYVRDDRGMVELTTENGVETTHTIYLENAVLNAFFKWVEKTRNVDIRITKREDETRTVS